VIQSFLTLNLLSFLLFLLFFLLILLLRLFSWLGRKDLAVNHILELAAELFAILRSVQLQFDPVEFHFLALVDYKCRYLQVFVFVVDDPNLALAF
jgi:hypothetical protein